MPTFRKNRAFLLKLFISIAMLLLILLYLAPLREILAAVSTARLFWLVCSFSLHALGILISAYRWQILIRAVAGMKAVFRSDPGLQLYCPLVPALKMPQRRKRFPKVNRASAAHRAFNWQALEVAQEGKIDAIHIVVRISVKDTIDIHYRN